ncbi:MAG: radical SAM protein [Armatimonadetes bacterium]|nr:radical SAM protein [Armatimonadota bacterium]
MFGFPFAFIAPAFDWLQVEVTSYCNAACVYCPHTIYRDNWLNRHLPLDTFQKLRPAFRKAGLVHLQGWGEPLLHPDFFTMVSLARQAGCRVGTATNGKLVDASVAARLVAGGLDFVAFSLAGTTAEKNDFFRRGTRLEKVLEAIRFLQKAKEEAGAARPAVHIAYLLLRSGIDELPQLPDLLEGYGIDQVVITTLDFVSSPALVEESLFLTERTAAEELLSSLQEVAARGKERGLSIYYQLSVPGQRKQVCSENVQRALFISADGLVSPCVFANVPVARATFLVRGAVRRYGRMTFGNVHDHDLFRIWRQKDYVNFRRSFSTGRLTAFCRECPKLSCAQNE